MEEVLLLHASPHLQGNTTKLMDYFSLQFSQVKTVFLADAIEQGCTNCGACSKEVLPFCIAMTSQEKELYTLFLSAKICIFIAPLYFYGLPACAKAFVDKSNYLYYTQRPIANFLFPVLHAGRKSSAEQFTGSILTLKYFAKVCGFSLQNPLCIPHTDAISVLHNTALLEEYCTGITNTIHSLNLL